MALDPLEKLDLSDLPDYDEDQEYRALLRALRRQEGFGIIFVRCSPDQGRKLVDDLTRDLYRKHFGVLTLTEPLPEGDFFGRAATFLAENQADVVFVQGLEHSLLEYEETKRQSGWTAAESRGYSWKGVPPILRNLNQQRDKFRNQLSACFVFLVPLYLVRYFTRRAPDFFDWRSGVFEFQDDAASIEQKVAECRLADRNKIKDLSEGERIQRALEIKDLLENTQIKPDQKFHLLLDLGLIQLANGDQRSLATSFIKACEIEVSEAKNLNIKGVFLSVFHRYEEAISSYEKSLELNPDNHEAWINRGDSLNYLGRYEEAVASYDTALLLKPNVFEAWNNRGKSLNNLGCHEEALVSYDKALDFNSDYYEAWYNRGKLLDELGEYEKAVSSYNHALVIEPDDYKSWYDRGNSLGELSNHQREAIASYERASNIQPDSPLPYVHIGSLYYEIGEVEKAYEAFFRLTKIQPSNADNWNNVGYLLLAKEVYGRTPVFQKPLAINSNKKCFFYDDRKKHSQDVYEEALELFNQSIKLDPQLELAWGNRSYPLYCLGDFQAALESCERSIQLELTEEVSHCNRGMIYLALSHYEEALTSFEASLAVQEDHADAFYGRACAYALLGQRDNAFENLKRAVALNPDHYRTLAQIDIDFDSLRGDERFQALLQGS